MELSDLGWSDFWATDEIEESDVARVLAVHRSHLRAAKKDKEINLHLSGQVTSPPVVGDWVLTTPEFEDEQGESAAIIREVLPRKSYLARSGKNGEEPLVANVDIVFVVTSANQDFNINRLQRFLVLVNEGGAQPFIVLTKTDLIDNSNELIDCLKETLNVDCLGTSIVDGSGVDELNSRMPGQTTSVFVGSSGVGKSSLVNKIMGEDIQQTSEIREDDDKGRHATRARQMFFVPRGGMIIDTPGIREVSIFASQDSIDETFPIIRELAEACRFKNCQHTNEPGCAINEALDSGELESKIWENYQKIQKEAAFAARKSDKAEMANSKKRWKEINQMMRQRRKIEESD